MLIKLQLLIRRDPSHLPSRPLKLRCLLGLLLHRPPLCRLNLHVRLRCSEHCCWAKRILLQVGRLDRRHRLADGKVKKLIDLAPPRARRADALTVRPELGVCHACDARCDCEVDHVAFAAETGAMRRFQLADLVGQLAD